jgi:hypothetical protein
LSGALAVGLITTSTVGANGRRERDTTVLIRSLDQLAWEAERHLST